VDTPESETPCPNGCRCRPNISASPTQGHVQDRQAAVKFTEDFLADGNFTVYSRLSDALGRSDMIATTPCDDAAGEDLGTEMVRNGLARVYGQGSE
jgi:endonuclease YncB( thermonuclease family)